MRTCLIFVAGMLTAQWLAADSMEEPLKRITSVVRADAKSGRLVRSVLATRRLPPVRVIAASRERADDRLGITDVGAIIEQAARIHDIDPLLVHSMIKIESNYNPFAVSPKGAMGLMQLMPATARQLGVKDAFDVRQNVDGGVRYYKYLRGLYKDDDRLALAAYNAGPGTVARYGNVPPFPETISYVHKVGKSYGKAKPAATPAQAAPEVIAKAELQFSKLEEFVAADGRIYLRTR